MTKKQKYYYIGASVLVLIGFFGYKSYAASKKPAKKKLKTSIEVELDKGTFTTPAEVKTQYGTRLRADSNTKSKIIITYEKNVRLIVVGDKKEKDGTWFKVNDIAGRTGWVREDVVDIVAPTSNPFTDDHKTLQQMAEQQLTQQQLAEWELYNI
jgi:mRNA-degrading endonuclease HigB of HigAB toxin-antitoxin module